MTDSVVRPQRYQFHPISRLRSSFMIFRRSPLCSLKSSVHQHGIVRATRTRKKFWRLKSTTSPLNPTHYGRNPSRAMYWRQSIVRTLSLRPARADVMWRCCGRDDRLIFEKTFKVRDSKVFYLLTRSRRDIERQLGLRGLRMS